LEESLTPGCEYLFQKIEDDDSEPLEIRAAVRNGLFCKDADIAVSAAKMLVQRANTFGGDLVPLLRDAYKHWQETEEPYPTNGGVIPASPRADLLRILLVERPPTIEELIEYSSDPRSDVREEVAPLLREEIAGDKEARSMFLDAVAAERIPSGALTKALRSSAPFSVEQIFQIKNLLKHRSPRIRFAAMGLLNTEYLSDREIQDISKMLQDDPEGEIRDRALEIGGKYADS
jgi:hypothetical protein